MAVTLRDFMSGGDVLTIRAVGHPGARPLGRFGGATSARPIVVEGGALVGIFTERDLLRAIADSRHPDAAMCVAT